MQGSNMRGMYVCICCMYPFRIRKAFICGVYEIGICEVCINVCICIVYDIFKRLGQDPVYTWFENACMSVCEACMYVCV